MSKAQPSPDIDTSFTAIRRMVPIVFIGTWILLAFLLNFLHWLNALYGAMLLTPILTTLTLRALEIRQSGLRFLPWRRAASLYGWSLVTWFSLVVLLYSLELWRGKWAYASLVHSVEESNRSLNVESLAPPMINESENFCSTPLLASLIKGNENAKLILGDFREITPSEELDRIRAVKLPDRKPRLKVTWYANKATNFDFWVRLFNRSTIVDRQTDDSDSAPEMILASLEPFSEILNELLEASRSRPGSRWDLAYERGWMVEALTGARDEVLENLISVLALRSSAYLALGKSESAANDLYLGIRLLETVRNEPSIHTQRHRISWLFTLFQPLWEGLATQKWSQTQLDQFKSDLEKIDLIEKSLRLRGSTALLQMDIWNEIDDAYSVQSLITNHRVLLKQDDGARFWVGLLWQLHPKGWTYQSQVLAYRWFFPLPHSNIRNTRPTDPINTIFIVPKLKALSRDIEVRLPESHVTIQQAIIACALEQFRIEHGEYPEKLSELTLNKPTLLKEIKTPLNDLVTYHRLPGKRYFLAPLSIQNPSATFEPENNPNLITLGNNTWDRVWRYPTDL